MAAPRDPMNELLEAWHINQRVNLRLIDAISDEGAKGVRTFKRGVAPMVAYRIAHESHHRGDILLTLKQCRHQVDRATQYAIWDRDRL